MSILSDYCLMGCDCFMATLSSEAIGRGLESIHLDGSSWLVCNWHREYADLKFDLLDSIQYNYAWHRVTGDLDAVDSLLEWVDVTPDWERIISEDDVAMFPSVLDRLKSFYLVNVDKDFCEDVSRLSYIVHCGGGELYCRSLSSCRAEYGVFRFRAWVGDNLFRSLRRHLQVTLEEFTSVYGEALLDDHDCCDELLVEMLVTGHLRGAVRSYKIEGEYYL